LARKVAASVHFRQLTAHALLLGLQRLDARLIGELAGLDPCFEGLPQGFQLARVGTC